MRLLISDNYIVETAYLYFVFEDFIQTNLLVPNEGYVSGGNIVIAYGNYTYFYNMNYTLYLGLNQVNSRNITESTPSYITFIAPPVPAPQIV